MVAVLVFVLTLPRTVALDVPLIKPICKCREARHSFCFSRNFVATSCRSRLLINLEGNAHFFSKRLWAAKPVPEAVCMNGAQTIADRRATVAEKTPSWDRFRGALLVFTFSSSSRARPNCVMTLNRKKLDGKNGNKIPFH